MASSDAAADEATSPASGGSLVCAPEQMARVFRALLSRTDDVYGVFDDAGRVLYISPACERLLGWRPDELIGQVLRAEECVHPDDLQRVLEYARQPRPGPFAAWEAISYRRRRRDGTHVAVESTGSCSGTHLYGIMRDVSEEHLAEAGLRELLLSTSYDLRVNAQNVQAASALLLLHDAVRADPEAAFLAAAVQSSCNLLLGIVSNVIEMRKLERGELALTRDTFSVAAALRDVLQSCAMGLQRGASGVRWVNEATAALPPLVQADLSHTSQIVQNLVTNAIKFSRGSEVRVSAALEPRCCSSSSSNAAEASDVLRVDVADSGTGLSAEECERMFKPFERTSPDKGGGTGLGLHISRAFARAMGGDVTVVSTPGVGSTFTLRVPVRVVAPGEVDSSAAEGADAEMTAAAQPCAPPANAGVLSEPVTPRKPPPLAVHGADAVTNTSSSNGSAVPATAEDMDAMVLRMLEELMTYAEEVFAAFPARGSDSSGFVYVSPSVRRVLGWEPAQLLGRSMLELTHPADVERCGALLRVVVADGLACMHTMHRCQAADGSYRWMHTTMYRQGPFILCTARDASRYKNTQAALRQYLLSTSHDLRTPCHGLMTALQLLAAREGVLRDPDASFLVQACRSGCGLMLGVISNIMELRYVECAGAAESLPTPSAAPSAATAAATAAASAAAAAVAAAKPVAQRESAADAAMLRLNLKPVSVGPAEMVDAVLHTCRVGCGLLRGRLEWVNEAEARQSLPPAVVADVDRLQQIVQNVLVYSLQHSPGDAPLTLEVKFDPAPGGAAGELRLEVCDPGRQQWSEECARIFAPNFLQSPAAAAGDVGSCSGLGLFVARALARAMGGDVYAECVGGDGGAVIHVRLPVALPDFATCGTLAATSPSAAHIAAASAAYAATATPPRGAKRAAGDDAGGAAAAPAAAKEPAARRRADAPAPPAPPETPLLGTAGTTASTTAKPRCLLVDDHALNIMLVQRLLERHGFEVTTAMNGLEALEQLQASSLGGAPGAPPAPDLALVDLQMPIMGGIELTRRFREWERATQPEGQRLVIVALSANVLDCHVAECRDAGFDGHLGKPLRADSIEQLRRYISAAAS